MSSSRFFLVRVFRYSKPLFFVFAAFILLSGYFNWKGVETTPFFIWAMYSGRMEPKTAYKLVTVTYNDDKTFNRPHTFNEPQSMMIYFTINHYLSITAHDMKDPMEDVLATVIPRHPFLRPFASRLVSTPEQNAMYLPWLKRYLQSIAGEPVYNLTIHQRLVHFDPGGRVVEDSSKVLFSIQ